MRALQRACWSNCPEVVGKPVSAARSRKVGAAPRRLALRQLDTREKLAMVYWMRQLRYMLTRVLTVWLVAAFVTGSFGAGSSGAASNADVVHDMASPAMQMGNDCPLGAEPEKQSHNSHAACAMTVCCFSDGPDLAVISPDFETMPADYAPFAERRLTQSEPERAKKPPKYA